MNTARQCGKTTSVGGRLSYKARNLPGRPLQVIIDPSQDQAREMMMSIEEFIYEDPDIEFDVDSRLEKILSKRGRIAALPGTERSVRGYRGPQSIALDEAARILETTYRATLPMLTGNEDAELLITSTPFGRRGFFHRIFTDPDNGGLWSKYLIVARWYAENGRLIEDVPEDQFQASWAERGVKAYYSPRHTLKFCQEMLVELGDTWYNQEMRGEFLDVEGAAFRWEPIEEAASDQVQPLYGFDGEEEEESAGGAEVLQI